MQNEYMKSMLEQELPEVPEEIEQRLRQVYAQLPETLPGKEKVMKRRRIKQAAAGISAVAAAFVLLLGTNSISPAFAESLPLVGGIFKQINTGRLSYENEQAMAEYVQAHTEPKNGEAVQVPANGLLEKPMAVSLQESYFDGRYVYAGLELNVDVQGKDGLLFDEESGTDILINGESQRDDFYGMLRNAQGFTKRGTTTYIKKTESGVFSAQQFFRVPEKYLGADSLEIVLKFQGLSEIRGGTVNSSPFEVAFTVDRTETAERRIEGNGLEMGGVKLIEAVSTPAGTEFTLEYPADYANPATGAIFEDGRPMGADADSFPLETEDGGARYTRIFAGMRENENRRVVYSVFDKNNTDQYVAVFILDFQAGTAELGTADDVKDADRNLLWNQDVEAIEATEEFQFVQVSLKEYGTFGRVLVLTDEASPRSVRLEVEQAGDTLYSLVTEKGRINGEMFQKDEPFGTGKNCYNLPLEGLEALDPASPAAFRLYDNETGELLAEKELTLTETE